MLATEKIAFCAGMASAWPSLIAAVVLVGLDQGWRLRPRTGAGWRGRWHRSARR